MYNLFAKNIVCLCNKLLKLETNKHFCLPFETEIENTKLIEKLILSVTVLCIVIPNMHILLG